MSEQLTIIARLRAKTGMEARVREVFSALRAPTHKEAGCLYYEMHQSLENPREFMFYENWSSTAHLDAHMKTAHFLAAIQVAPEILVVLSKSADGPW